MNRTGKQIAGDIEECCGNIIKYAKKLNSKEDKDWRVKSFINAITKCCSSHKVSERHIRKIMDIEKDITMATIRKVARYEDK